MIKAAGLTKKYGDLLALSDFSLEVSGGEIVALVGPNGAGKTTALNLLVGLLTPTSGEAWICGHHVIREAQKAKNALGFIPDHPFLYEHLTLSETLSFICGMYRLTKEQFSARAQGLLDLFGLGGRLGSRIGELSHGMKSRVVLLCNFLHNPRALILDEPFFGLDPQTLRLAKQLLREKAGEGTAVLLSTHQLPVVEDVADRIVILNDGRTVALGRWDELKQLHGDSRLEELFFRLTVP